MSNPTQQHADSRDMYIVHNTLRQGFHEVPGLARNGSAHTARAALVANHALLFAEVLHTHHEAEDAVLWPKLLERCPDEVDPLVESMEHQHEALGPLLSSVVTTAEAFRETAGDADAEALASAVERLLPVLDEHLRDEENLILPLIDRYLTQEEWAAVGEHGLPDIPAEIVPVYFGMVLRVATDDQRGVLRANVGEAVFGQILLSGPPALAQYEQTLHPGGGLVG